MKRADLVPGDEYLTSRIHDWHQPGSHGIKRVRVLDDQPWAKERHGSLTRNHEVITSLGELAVPEALQPVSTGTGVLVEELDQASGEPLERNRYRVVQLAQFHATWEVGSAKRQEVLDAKRAEADARDAEIKAFNDRAEAAAAVLGATEAEHRNWFGSGPKIVFNLEDAEALAEEIKRLRTAVNGV